MLRRTGSTGKFAFTGEASGGVNPLEKNIILIFRTEDLVEESTGERGLRRIRAEVMQGCASATNFRPAAV